MQAPNLAGELRHPLVTGWQLTSSSPSFWATPSAIDPDATWHDAPVPGTVAAALSTAALWDHAHPTPLDDQDHWYRTSPGRRRPCAACVSTGWQTLAEVFFDNEPVCNRTICSWRTRSRYSFPVGTNWRSVSALWRRGSPRNIRARAGGRASPNRQACATTARPCSAMRWAGRRRSIASDLGARSP